MVLISFISMVYLVFFASYYDFSLPSLLSSGNYDFQGQKKWWAFILMESLLLNKFMSKNFNIGSQD